MDAPITDQEFVGQGVQTPLGFVMGLYAPARQVEHTELLVAPVVELNVPAGQEVHTAPLVDPDPVP